MSFINLVFDRYGQVNNFHDILYTFPTIECTGKGPFVQCFRLNSELCTIHMTQPIENRFQCLFGKIIITGYPGCILLGINPIQKNTFSIPVINKLLVWL